MTVDPVPSSLSLVSVDGTDVAVVVDGDQSPVAKPSESPQESIGVALSGGGVRAALFSLGVLTGLVDCRQNRHVSHVSSVSGGSIVNAAVAQSCRYSEVSEPEFHAVAKPIATRLCRRGMFVFSGAAVWGLIKAVAKVFSGIVVAVVAASSVLVSVASAVSGASWFSLQWFIPAMVAAVLMSLFLARGFLQEGLYMSFLAALAKELEEPASEQDSSPDDGKKPTPQSPLRETTHVIVSTDLVSGQPVYFSRDFVYCPAYGWGDPGTMRPASAVQASAAFPFVFPVRWFLRRPFRFQNGMSQPPFPRWLKLTDGGVYNNLGTDWFDVIDPKRRPDIWEFGNLALTRPLVPIEKQIVVNAGAASRGLRKVRPFLAISRTMNVLYDNTVRPRLDALKASADGERRSVVVDISESPSDIARRLADVESTTPDGAELEAAESRRARATELATRLGRRQEPYWIEFARQTSSTRTKLSKAGLEAGARVMLHGYLSTVVVMHVLHDADLPDVLKDEGYFLDLAGRSPLRSGTATDEVATPVAVDQLEAASQSAV